MSDFTLFCFSLSDFLELTIVTVEAASYVTISQLFRVGYCNCLSYVPTQLSELNTVPFTDTLRVTTSQQSELVTVAVRVKLHFLHQVNCQSSLLQPYELQFAL